MLSRYGFEFDKEGGGWAANPNDLGYDAFISPFYATGAGMVRLSAGIILNSHVSYERLSMATWSGINTTSEVGFSRVSPFMPNYRCDGQSLRCLHTATSPFYFSRGGYVDLGIGSQRGIGYDGWYWSSLTSTTLPPCLLPPFQ